MYDGSIILIIIIMSDFIYVSTMALKGLHCFWILFHNICKII